jgi:hypothetical protein
LSFEGSSLKPWEEFKDASRSITTKKTKELKRNTTKKKNIGYVVTRKRNTCMFLLLIPCNKAIACHKEKKYCSKKKKPKKHAIRRKELFFFLL